MPGSCQSDVNTKDVWKFPEISADMFKAEQSYEKARAPEDFVEESPE